VCEVVVTCVHSSVGIGRFGLVQILRGGVTCDPV